MTEFPKYDDVEDILKYLLIPYLKKEGLDGFSIQDVQKVIADNDYMKTYRILDEMIYKKLLRVNKQENKNIYRLFNPKENNLTEEELIEDLDLIRGENINLKQENKKYKIQLKEINDEINKTFDGKTTYTLIDKVKRTVKLYLKSKDTIERLEIQKENIVNGFNNERGKVLKLQEQLQDKEKIVPDTPDIKTDKDLNKENTTLLNENMKYKTDYNNLRIRYNNLEIKLSNEREMYQSALQKQTELEDTNQKLKYKIKDLKDQNKNKLELENNKEQDLLELIILALQHTDKIEFDSEDNKIKVLMLSYGKVIQFIRSIKNQELAEQLELRTNNRGSTSIYIPFKK